MGVGLPQGQVGPPPQRRNTWTIVLLLLLLLLVGAGVAWFVLRDGGSGSGSVPLAEGEVFMEPAAAVGPDPFSAQPLAPPPDPLIAQPAIQTPTRIAAPPQAAIQASSGAQPGLYGGTQNDTACDKAQMIAFLAANPDKAAAWVAAQNADPSLRWTGPSGPAALTAADIPAYIGTLTPLVLVADTRVTNHGFVAGKATPRQSVMQKGSAVLVDTYGVPRARCYCGNPLLPPVPAKVQVTYVGSSWPGFDPGTVGVVSPAPQPVKQFEVRMPDGSMKTITVGGPAPAASPVGGATAAGSSPTAAQPTLATTAIATTTALVPATATVLVPATATAPATAIVPATAVPATAVPATAVPATAVPPTAVPPTDVPQSVTVNFVSTCVDPVNVYWVDFSGTPQFRFTLQPGERWDGHNTTVGHVFRFENLSASWDWTVPAGGGTHRICG